MKAIPKHAPVLKRAFFLFERLRQEDHMFEPSLGNLVRLSHLEIKKE